MKNIWAGVAGAAILALISSSTALAGGSGASVYRLYSPSTGEHFLTANHDEAIANGCTSPGYSLEAAGYFLSDSMSSGGATTVSRLYNPHTGDHLLSISAVEIPAALNAGYSMETPDAFLAHTTYPSGGVTVFRLRNTHSGVHLYTWSAAERDAAMGQGFTNEGPVFYFSPQANIPVDRLFNPTTGDHLYTANSLETDAVNCQHPTYVNEGSTYAANLGSAGGDVQVSRLVDKHGFHFFTANPSEEAAAVTAGYRYEGVAFYAYPSATGGFSPVYRLRNTKNGDHLFTLSSSERDLASSQGYVSEGIGYYVAVCSPGGCG